MTRTYYPSGIQVGPRGGEGAPGGSPIGKIIIGGGAIPGGATSVNVTLTGARPGDRVFTQATGVPTNASAIKKAAVSAADTVTVTATADPGAAGLAFDLLVIG